MEVQALKCQENLQNVVFLCRLLNILANFSNLVLHTDKHVDPDQTVPRGAA